MSIILSFFFQIIVIAIIIVSLVFTIICLKVILENPILRYKTFQDYAEVYKKEIIRGETFYAPDPSDESKLFEIHDDRHNVYLIYDEKIYVVENERIYDMLRIGEKTHVIIHQGYDLLNRVRDVYITAPDYKSPPQ